MVYHRDETTSTTSPEKNTEYADIYIPVPYDPEIPGVRCVDALVVEQVEHVDAEEIENVNLAMGMVNIAFNDEKTKEEVLELQDLQSTSEDILI